MFAGIPSFIDSLTTNFRNIFRGFLWPTRGAAIGLGLAATLDAPPLVSELRTDGFDRHCLTG